jgi:peptide/nickel transport system permease protein
MPSVTSAHPPKAERRLMLNALRTAIHVQPWMAMRPQVCIFVASICFDLLSSGLRQALGVKG